MELSKRIESHKSPGDDELLSVLNKGKKRPRLQDIFTLLPMEENLLNEYEATLKKNKEVCIGEYPVDIANSIVLMVNEYPKIMAYTEDTN